MPSSKLAGGQQYSSGTKSAADPLGDVALEIEIKPVDRRSI